MEPFTITTDRLVLDELRPDDAPAVFEYCQDPDFERYLTIPWPYQIGDAQYFITEHVPAGWESGNELSWAMRLPSDELLGVIGLRTKFGRYDIGFWLGAAHRGQGYMPEAVRAVLDWAFDAGLAEEISWECVAGNLASAVVARKLGFTFGGVRPSVLPARDGSHPESWHGVLRASDDRSVKHGWPLASSRLGNVGAERAQHEGDSTG